MKKLLLLIMLPLLFVGCKTDMEVAKAYQYCIDNNTSYYHLEYWEGNFEVTCKNGLEVKLSPAVFEKITGSVVTEYITNTE